ncbi:MAG: acylphosphatase [Telmatospirillum sp.]|nr:acylphosphatase [Telmatospirillum sp.]
MAADVCRHVVIEGHVQGVWFRGWTMERARALGLAGWVRNRSDGSVEALFLGEAAAVAAMVAACRRGPPAAVVTRLTEEAGVPPDRPGFRSLPTM